MTTVYDVTETKLIWKTFVLIKINKNRSDVSIAWERSIRCSFVAVVHLFHSRSSVSLRRQTKFIDSESSNWNFKRTRVFVTIKSEYLRRLRNLWTDFPPKRSTGSLDLAVVGFGGRYICMLQCSKSSLNPFTPNCLKKPHHFKAMTL